MSVMKKHHRDDEINYWQSISDVMAALLLVVLLIMMLFILYMTRMPDIDIIDEFYTSDDDDIGADLRDNDWGDLYHTVHTLHEGWGDDHTSGAGGGYGGDEVGHGNDEGRYPYTNEGVGDFDGTHKAAVHVTVRDGETGLNIKQEGISFQLFLAGDGQQVLQHYYPSRERYEQFETTVSGNFYLPEKVRLGHYHFHELTVPYGYDASDDVYFTIEESTEWDAPFTVLVELFPCRNVIYVHGVDSVSGVDVPASEYDVIAAQDVITADGSLRYSQGEVVDHIVCNEKGQGESQELYLGQYLLKQTAAARFYAEDKNEIVVDLVRKDAPDGNAVHMLQQEKTMIHLTVSDELYPSTPVVNAEYELIDESGNSRTGLRTDRAGSITVENLEKAQTYRLRQVNAPNGYLPMTEELAFTVSADGRVDETAIKEFAATNRMIRVTVGVTDQLFRSGVSDKSLALYSEDDSLVKLWTTSAVPETIEGIKPGLYKLVLNGKEMQITIENTAELQHFAWTTWTTGSIATVTGSAFIVILAIIGISLKVNQTRKQRKEEK